jgi:two-component sensor histidine kinase/HAMP domain-containing protein
MNNIFQKLNTISSKMMIIISSLFLLFSISVIIYLPDRLKNEIITNELQKADLAGSLVSSSIGAGIYFLDNESLQKEVNNLSKLKNILFVLITNNSDSLIYSQKIEVAKSLHYNYAYKNHFISDTILYSITNINFNDNFLGKIHIGYSLAPHFEYARNQSIIIIIFSFLILFAGICISLLISRIITKQLNEIIRTAHSVKSGNLSYRVKIISNDEVGFLARKFNDMLDNIDELYTNLENKVNLRTTELQKVNSTLHSEITNRINAEEKINASLQEKEVLLKEIHHRVKNNLQVISSLLYLQSKKIEIKEYKDIFNESQNRIKSMALVHENLYKSDNFAGIELSDYIRSLVNYLIRTYNVNYNKIKQVINIDKIILSIDKSIPFGLIINELVTNSLKYAFNDRDEGLFKVEIHKLDSGIIHVSVFDNGVGMPADFDIKKSNSLGLKLVKTLVEQLEGTFQWNSNGGTEFIIEFSETQKERIVS